MSRRAEGASAHPPTSFINLLPRLESTPFADDAVVYPCAFGGGGYENPAPPLPPAIELDDAAPAPAPSPNTIEPERDASGLAPAPAELDPATPRPPSKSRRDAYRLYEAIGDAGEAVSVVEGEPRLPPPPEPELELPPPAVKMDDSEFKKPGMAAAAMAAGVIRILARPWSAMLRSRSAVVVVAVSATEELKKVARLMHARMARTPRAFFDPRVKDCGIDST